MFSPVQPPPKPSALILELNVDPFEGSVWLKKFPLAMRFETYLQPGPVFGKGRGLLVEIASDID
jgi:hypothetical protein